MSNSSPLIGILVSCSWLLTAAFASAQPVTLYGRFEQALKPPQGAQPSVDLPVEFTSPSGKTCTRSVFDDGGSTCRVRFMPTEEGVWTWRARGVTPGAPDQSGRFECRKSDSPNPFLRHGPIRVSVDGTHFEHFDGTPFFFLADTTWNGVLLSKKDDWDRYLADRVAKHFSGIQFVMLAPWRTAPANAEGLIAFSGEKSITIHPDFYKRIDDRMAQIESAGLLAVPVLMWAWGKKDAGQALPEEEAIRLIKYQVNRYSAHHVIWILNGDSNCRGEVAERWKRIGRAVFADQQASLAPVTLHPGGRIWPYDAFRDEKWLGIHGYQSGHTDAPDGLAWAHSGPVSKEWQRQPIRPYVNLEPPYEDHISGYSKKRFSAHAVRRACYWSLLAAPPAGLTYGGHGIWSWQEVEGPPFDHAYTGVAKPWHIAKDLPGASSMKHMTNFFTSIEWWKLRPAQSLLAVQPGDGDSARFISAAKSGKGDLAVFYLPAGGEVSFSPDQLVKDVRAEWFDPRTAQRFPADSTTPGRYSAPDDQDWVLLVR